MITGPLRPTPSLERGSDIDHRCRCDRHIPGPADRYRAKDRPGPVRGNHGFPRPGRQAAGTAQDADHGGNSGRAAHGPGRAVARTAALHDRIAVDRRGRDLAGSGGVDGARASRWQQPPHRGQRPDAAGAVPAGRAVPAQPGRHRGPDDDLC